MALEGIVSKRVDSRYRSARAVRSLAEGENRGYMRSRASP
jgi:hypothetical protein